MAITAISEVFVDKEEYSKFEPDNAVITVDVVASGTGGAGDTEQLTFELTKARRTRDSIVYSKTYQYPSGTIDSTAPTRVTLDTRDALSSPDLIQLIRRGEYFVKVYVTGDTDVTANTSDFSINIVTSDRVKKEFCFGLDLQSSDIRSPKYQPRDITGVQIVGVSRNHKLSLFPLRYTVDTAGNRFLTWDNGQTRKVIKTYTNYLLPASPVGAEFIEVKIDWYRLPTSSVSEEIFIEESVITDATIRRHINDACDSFEGASLHVYLEPTSLVTDVDASLLTFAGDSSSVVINDDYDFIATPVTLYPYRGAGWMQINMPFTRILRVDQLYGSIANTRIVQINPEWVELTTSSNFIQLVPFNTDIAFDFTGLVWVEALHNGRELPNFWHYNALAGLRDVSGDLIKALGFTAAIPILTQAGAAFRGGYSSQSISRDGINESVSYTSSAIYGIYSATIEEYKAFLKEEMPKLKMKYRGPNLWVV